MSAKQLLDAMNAADFRAFPPKGNQRSPGLSIKIGDDRYFINRVASGLDQEGRATYMWALGAKFEKQS